jgi:hypothetical protein
MNNNATKEWYKSALVILTPIARPGTISYQLKREAEGALKALDQGLSVRIPARTITEWGNNVRAANPNGWTWSGDVSLEEDVDLIEDYRAESVRAFDPKNLDKVDESRYYI